MLSDHHGRNPVFRNPQMKLIPSQRDVCLFPLRSVAQGFRGFGGLGFTPVGWSIFCFRVYAADSFALGLRALQLKLNNEALLND